MQKKPNFKVTITTNNASMLLGTFNTFDEAYAHINDNVQAGLGRITSIYHHTDGSVAFYEGASHSYRISLVKQTRADRKALTRGFAYSKLKLILKPKDTVYTVVQSKTPTRRRISLICVENSQLRRLTNLVKLLHDQTLKGGEYLTTDQGEYRVVQDLAERLFGDSELLNQVSI